MDGGARRFKLQQHHRAQAQATPLVGLSFVPSLKLSQTDVLQRFGPPSQRQTLDAGAVQLAYADRGLVVTVAEGRRSVLQYVAPRELQGRLLAAAKP